jgi:hypothetical protein
MKAADRKLANGVVHATEMKLQALPAASVQTNERPIMVLAKSREVDARASSDERKRDLV